MVDSTPDEDIIDAEVVEPRSAWEILDSPAFQQTYIVEVPNIWVGKDKPDAKGVPQRIKEGDRIIRNPAHPDIFMMFSDNAALQFVQNGLVWDKDCPQQVAEGIDISDPNADRSISQLIEQDERPLLNRLFHDPLSLFRRRTTQTAEEIQRRTYAEQMREGRTVVDEYPDARKDSEKLRTRVVDLNHIYLTQAPKRCKDIDGVWVKKGASIICNARVANPKKFLLDTPANRLRFIRNRRRLGGL